MGVSSTANRIGYSGNGATTTFSFPYYFFSVSDVVVYLYDTVAGTATLQVITTQYTISGTPNAQGLYPNGASVVFVAAPSATQSIVILRNPTQTQTYSLLQNSLISSTAIVQQLDYLTLLAQRLEDKVSRAILLPDGMGATFSPTLPTSIALTASEGLAIIVNPSGTGLTLGATGGGGGGGITSLTGDVTGAGVGAVAATIAVNAVTNAKAAQMATLTLKGNSTGGLSNAQDLTVSQVNAILPVVTTVLNGVAPASGGGTANFLRADGTWTAPSGTATLTTKGDVFGFSTLNARVPVGTDGQILQADSTQALGVKYAAVANASLATMAANTVKANVTGGVAVPTDVSLTSAPTASSVCIRDSNSNLQLNNLIESGQSIASAAGTTTLVVGSPYFTQITGVTTQTVVMPAANTLTLYQSFLIGNRSSGVVTANANGGSLLQSIAAGSQAIFTCTSIGSTTGTWDVSYAAAGFVSPMTTGGDIIYGGASGVATRLPNGSINQVLTSAGGASAPAWSAVANASLATMAASTVKANVTGGAAVPTDVGLVSTATVSTVPIRDSNANFQLNNLIANGQSVVSAAGTTTLAVGSPYFTQITGATTQTVVMPDATTLKLYQSFLIGNRSSGVVTANANGGGLLQSMLGGSTQAIFTVTNIGSAAGSWDVAYSSAGTTSPLTTKGDTYVYSTVNARQPVPSDNALLIADSAQTTGWRSLSYINSRGPKNYIQYGDFENNATTGWTATGCATVTNGLPVTVGSGGTAFSSANGGRAKGANTNSPAIDSSSAVSGTYAMNLATTGAGVIGDGYISSSYTIDKSDQAKVLSYKFNYKVASGTPVMAGDATNTYAVAIYDIVNNAWLGLAGNFNIVQSSGTGIAQGSFQSASNTTGIQIFIYSPVAPTGTSSFLIDDVFIGPQSLAFGPAMSDFGSTAWTPTGTWAANVTYIGRYRRVGDTAEFNVNVALTGAPTGTFTVNAPTGMTFDTTKVSKTQFQSIGVVYATSGGGTTNRLGTIYLDTASTVKIVSDAGSQWNATTPGVFGNTDFVTMDFAVPIVGWSSNSVQSSDTDTRVVEASYSNVGADSVINGAFGYGTKITDTHAAYNTGTGKFTAPISGYYQYQATLYVGATTVNLSALVNSVAISQGPVVSTAANSAATYGTAFLNAGDTLQINADAVATTNSQKTLSRFHIFRLSGPATIAASESVNARYYASATSISGSLATVSWSTKDFDSHNAMSAGVYTAPVNGKYQVNSYIGNTGTFALNNLLTIEIQKNSTVVSRAKVYAGGVITQIDGGVSDAINCLAGDTIRIQVSNSGTTPAIVSSNFENWLSIARIGN